MFGALQSSANSDLDPPLLLRRQNLLSLPDRLDGGNREDEQYLLASRLRVSRVGKREGARRFFA